MVSARLSEKFSIGRFFSSGRRARAIPKITENTTIGSTCPSATALAMFSGKISRIWSCQPGGGTSGSFSSVPSGTSAPAAFITPITSFCNSFFLDKGISLLRVWGTSIFFPAWVTLMATSPITRAMVVTTSK
ncbi:hypothetical protein FQZ97_993830 [compost metagenome]